MKKLIFAFCVLVAWAYYAQASPMRRGFNEYYASGANNPGQLNHLLLWLRGDEAYTDAGCTAAAADTNAVACWKDKSGNGYNFTQATAGNKPTYAASVANLNNQPSLDLESDGGVAATSDYMQSTEAALKLPHDVPLTIIVVYEVETQDDWSTLYSYRRANAAFEGFSLLANVGILDFDMDAGAESLRVKETNTLLASSEKHVITVRKTSSFASSAVSFMSDNVPISDTDVVNTLTAESDIVSAAPNINVGAYEGNVAAGAAEKFFDGRIAEVIVYTDRLTDSEVKALHENYLCPRYALC